VHRRLPRLPTDRVQQPGALLRTESTPVDTGRARISDLVGKRWIRHQDDAIDRRVEPEH